MNWSLLNAPAEDPPLPASTMVQVSRLFDARQLIETDAIAFIPAGHAGPAAEPAAEPEERQ